MKIIIRKASSIFDGFRKAVDLIEKWAEPDKPAFCWFRGVNDRNLKLKPGAIWRSKYNEFEAMVTFVQEGVAFANVGSIESWDTYYLAQHHGMPTRLLDWTESFSAAMFFALDNIKKRKVPCVWILQPERFNKQYLGWSGILAPENQPKLNAWLPSGNRKHTVEHDGEDCYDNKHTLAIYAKKSNHRIVAQQGAFTLHGRDRRPICEMVAKDFKKPDSVLARIDFEDLDLKEAKLHLERLGVKRSSIYPDIDNFVKQVGESYWPERRKNSKNTNKTKIVKKTVKKAAKKMAKKSAI